MSGLKRKYKASTLIEVLVAMIIIIVCAGIGMVSVSNLSRDINGNLSTEAEIIMSKVMNDTKYEKDFTDKIFELPGFRVERSVLSYKAVNRLKILRVEAFNTQDRRIGEIREIILMSP